ncbi:hypothetical protein SAMN04488057_111118 [Cyclobacterium lianum]|uniref:Uncharacterized protein n=1 Tax=Cyclobacterium lianum TaxID=388280 RepID=A0A1M7PX30_9BACT|nr:hypothetical protein [Cyclobacterium lianum]SHN22247.1 hypothetical protein SAMN04488057_111118 [Cyclobacterium lianum]
MITTLKKITLLLGSGLLILNLVSCNEDEEPCTDQTLEPLRLIVTDMDDNNLLDEDSDFELADFALFYQDGNDWVELTVTLEETSEEVPFIESMEAAEESLEGNTEFQLVLADDESVSFDFVVTMTDTSGCDVYTYEGTDTDGEDLGQPSDGTPKPYIIQIDLETAS